MCACCFFFSKALGRFWQDKRGEERVQSQESRDSSTTMERPEGGGFWLAECSSERSLQSRLPVCSADLTSSPCCRSQSAREKTYRRRKQPGCVCIIFMWKKKKTVSTVIMRQTHPPPDTPCWVESPCLSEEKTASRCRSFSATASLSLSLLQSGSEVRGQWHQQNGFKMDQSWCDSTVDSQL